MNKPIFHGRDHWITGADPIKGLKLEELDIPVDAPATGTPTFGGDFCETDFTPPDSQPIFVPALTQGQLAVVVGVKNNIGSTLAIAETGWTELVQGQGLDSGVFHLLTAGLWWHRAATDEAATSITLTGGTSNLAGSSAMWVLGGGEIGDFEMVIHTGGVDIDAPSVTAETADATLLCCWIASRSKENVGGGDMVWTTPTGMTADCQILQGLQTSFTPEPGTPSNQWPPLLSAHEESVGVGATGVRTSSHNTGLGGANKPLVFSLIVEDAA